MKYLLFLSSLVTLYPSIGATSGIYDELLVRSVYGSRLSTRDALQYYDDEDDHLSVREAYEAPHLSIRNAAPYYGVDEDLILETAVHILKRRLVDAATDAAEDFARRSLNSEIYHQRQDEYKEAKKKYKALPADASAGDKLKHSQNAANLAAEVHSRRKDESTFHQNKDDGHAHQIDKWGKKADKWAGKANEHRPAAQAEREQRAKDEAAKIKANDGFAEVKSKKKKKN